MHVHEPIKVVVSLDETVVTLEFRCPHHYEAMLMHDEIAAAIASGCLAIKTTTIQRPQYLKHGALR